MAMELGRQPVDEPRKSTKWWKCSAVTTSNHLRRIAGPGLAWRHSRLQVPYLGMQATDLLVMLRVELPQQAVKLRGVGRNVGVPRPGRHLSFP